MRKILLLFLLIAAQAASAQDTLLVPSLSEPEREAFGHLAVGHTNILDTYLSPENYTGFELRYFAVSVRNRPGCRWARQMTHQGYVSSTDMRTGDGRELGGMYNFQYAWQRKVVRRQTGSGEFRLRAGAAVDATIGFLYNTRNGNNPAQARLSLCLTPNAVASYKFSIGNTSHTLQYELAVPLFGVMFSPAYGQSYYELFSRGNYDHNICPVWVGNAPSMCQLLTFSFPFWRTVFRIGYLGDYEQARVNSLKYHQYTHSFVFGWRL